MAVVKVIELVGTSDQGWEQAAMAAVDDASKTIRNIETVEITNLSATIEDGKIGEYQADVRIAFRLEAELRSKHHEHHIVEEKTHI
jgi:flavin-binding protein dodecin